MARKMTNHFGGKLKNRWRATKAEAAFMKISTLGVSNWRPRRDIHFGFLLNLPKQIVFTIFVQDSFLSNIILASFVSFMFKFVNN